MSEEILPYIEFNPQTMIDDFYTKGFYCFFDPSLKSLITNTKWSKIPGQENHFTLDDEIAKKTCESIIYKKIDVFSNLKIRHTRIGLGIDKDSCIWHDDNSEKMFCQALCYQSDLNEHDGGALRLKCKDGIERFFYPKNGHVVVVNHQSEVVHKVDKLISDKQRIMITIVFDLK